MTAWRGLLVSYLDPSLVGVAELSTQAAGCRLVHGRNSAPIQADDHAGKPREDITGGTTMLATHPMAAD